MNKKNYILLIIFFISFFPGNSFSDDLLKVKNIEDLIRKTLNNHPEMQMMKIEKEKIMAGKKSAYRIPNPELDSRLLYGLYNNKINSEYSIKQPIELGGKRGARIKEIETRLSIYDKKILMKKQNIIKETILTLYRLRQINTEKNIIKETLSTYLSILRKMKRLPGLKPELIISKDIYLLSIEENKEKIIHLNGEKIKLITRLKLHSGTKLKNINSFLPDPIYNWPKIKKTIHLKSPLLAVAIFEREAAKSKFDIARSDSWPDLMLGPVFAHEGKNKNSFSGGITFSLTAPIFYNNDGERETSKKNIKLSILNITLLKKRLQVTRDAYLDQYNLYKSKLKRNNKNRSNRHKRLHRFLNRGMISASLVIEYHRQELEFREYSHKSEIEALNSLWSIYSIDGTILREANYEK